MILSTENKPNFAEKFEEILILTNKPPDDK